MSLLVRDFTLTRTEAPPLPGLPKGERLQGLVGDFNAWGTAQATDTDECVAAFRGVNVTIDHRGDFPEWTKVLLSWTGEHTRYWQVQVPANLELMNESGTVVSALHLSLPGRGCRNQTVNEDHELKITQGVWHSIKRARLSIDLPAMGPGKCPWLSLTVRPGSTDIDVARRDESYSFYLDIALVALGKAPLGPIVDDGDRTEILVRTRFDRYVWANPFSRADAYRPGHPSGGGWVRHPAIAAFSLDEALFGHGDRNGRLRYFIQRYVGDGREPGVIASGDTFRIRSNREDLYLCGTPYGIVQAHPTERIQNAPQELFPRLQILKGSSGAIQHGEPVFIRVPGLPDNPFLWVTWEWKGI
jgi:hypothetical protein